MREGQFAEYYGGGIYYLTVYGPDPKGRHDPINGVPIVKALTKPIRITMRGAPVLDIEPGDEPGAMPHWARGRGEDMREFWDPTMGRGGMPLRRPMPPTPAEATIHGQALNFATEQVREERREARDARRRAEEMGGSGVSSVVSAVSDQAKQTVDTLREELGQMRSSYAEMMRQRDEEKIGRAHI